MYSSVFFNRFSNKIHLWEYNAAGKKVHSEYPAPLYFYVKSDTGEYTSIYGDKLKRISFESATKMRETREMFKAAEREMFESDITPENRFILDHYAGKELTIPKLDIHFIDIEVHSEMGFPNPAKAEHPITIITVYSTKHNKWFVWTEKEFSLDFDIKIKKGKTKEEDVVVKFSSLNPWVKVFSNEAEMLESFIAFVKKTHPDCLSGWNSSGFDIPYIINRIKKLLSEDHTKLLSPVKHIRKFNKKRKYGPPIEMFEIAGINCIDYLEVYRKYVPGEQESFKLGHIAKVELGESKLEYDGTLKELYKNEWNKYCQYNIQDVNLLCLLDMRLKYINMMVGICYNCTIPFEQFDKTTKVLDGAFISRLLLDKVILPDVSHEGSEEGEDKYEGAYVKEPVPGMYDWVMCFDATSLYPSIMMQHNMSPETKVMVVSDDDAKYICSYFENGDESRLDEMTAIERSFRDIISEIKTNKYTIASNGAIYRHDKSGVVAKFVKEWFDNRQKHKTLMKKAQKEGNSVEEQYHDGLQYVYKILINSVYGYLGSKYARLYDRDNALAVTITGQNVIKRAEHRLSSFFTNEWDQSEIGKRVKASKIPGNVVIYCDTDSLYLHGGEVLRSFNYPHINDTQKCLAFMRDKVETLFQKLITNEMVHFTTKSMNAQECKIFFKREMIARRTIFVSKKRYVANILDMEGKIIPDGDDHEVEAKGLDLIRSTIPSKIRKLMKELLTNILKNTDKKSADETIRQMKEIFYTSNINDIAKIININNMGEYTDEYGKPIKGTPQQVKAAIGHNELVQQKNLEDGIDLIYEGDKVKLVYIRDTPYYKYNTIAFKDDLPEEFGLSQFVDYDIMWEKLFVDPMLDIYDIIGWKRPNIDFEDLSDLFT